MSWAARVAHFGRSKHVWCSTARPDPTCLERHLHCGHIFLILSWSPGCTKATVPHHLCKYLDQTLSNAVQEHSGTHSGLVGLLSAIDPKYPSTTPWDPLLLPLPASPVWWGNASYDDDDADCIHIVNHSDVHCDDDQGDNDPSGPKVWTLHLAYIYCSSVSWHW